MFKFLLLVLLCSILPINQSETHSNINRRMMKNDVTEESLLENEKSVELAVEFEKALNSFNNMRSVLYVDDNKYGGIFVDEDDILNINQTNDFGIDYLELIDSINEEKIDVKINAVQYSLDNLLNVKQYIDNNLLEMVNSLYISQEDNNIVITVKENAYIDIINEILINNIDYFDSSMLEFKVDDTLSSLTNSIKAGNKIQYKEGWWIFATTSYGTVGFNAVDSNGNRGVVTNYHVAPEDKKMTNEDEELLGYASICVLNSTVDASFVPFSTQGDWESTNYVECSDPSFKITRTADPVEGARVWKVGATTGSTYGNITSIYGSATCNYGDLGGVRTITDVIVSDCECEGGDSGGPVITWTNRLSNQGIYGITFAKHNTETLTYACKIDNVLESLGVTIY